MSILLSQLRSPIAQVRWLGKLQCRVAGQAVPHGCSLIVGIRLDAIHARFRHGSRNASLRDTFIHDSTYEILEQHGLRLEGVKGRASIAADGSPAAGPQHCLVHSVATGIGEIAAVAGGDQQVGQRRAVGKSRLPSLNSR